MSRYVVVDLEMCKVPRGTRKQYGRAMETIQIGAVLLNDNYELIDSFMTLVNPRYGTVDKYINNLTGISQNDVYSAPGMADAINSFFNWIPDDNVKMVSWSLSDLYQLQHEFEAYDIDMGKFNNLIETWIDCQKMFSEIMDEERIFKLDEALIASEINTSGRAHDGFDDAYNTALLFAKMETEPIFKLNEYYKKAHSGESERLTYSLGDLFKSLNIAV